MMDTKKIRVAIVGYGNVGRGALQAVAAAPDLELAGVVRSSPVTKGVLPPELHAAAVVADVGELPGVDVALLCAPTRKVTALALNYLSRGINTVDSFDLHGEELLAHREKLAQAARRAGAAAVVSAGWDPGTDSWLRALMELMAPRGLTFTNFGPGMSLGHSVAAKGVRGVADAMAVTIPKGSGVHRRLVYVQLERGAALAEVAAQIKADPYFSRDETHVYQVEAVDALRDVGHGVVLERKGTSGAAGNQLFRWDMRINNPALTGQIMAAAARAGAKQPPGAYTLLEIPLTHYFWEEPDELIRRLL